MDRYWFKPRRYGYGAMPASWEGWLITALTCVVVAGSIAVMQLTVSKSDSVAWMVWAAIIVVVVFGFVQLARTKTDGEWRWRWGDDRGA